MFSMNPRELKRLMKRMGIDVQEMQGVKSVTLTLSDKEVIIKDPQVTVMNVQGRKVYQIISASEEVVEASSEEVAEVTFSEDDINFVMSQAVVGREKAVEALRKANGDIARAILLLTSKSK